MCSRYKNLLQIARMRLLFATAPDGWLDESDRRYRTFYPGSKVPVVGLSETDLAFRNLRWGILPPNETRVSKAVANTRIETALKLGMWKESFRARRCLLPADAFFEPIAGMARTTMAKFELKSGAPFAFAGLYGPSTFKDERVNCCSMLTTEPNALVSPIHNRMPVILHPDQFDMYLRTPAEEAELLIETFSPPYPAEEMTVIEDSSSDKWDE